MKLEKLVFTKDNGEIVEFTLDELKNLQQIMLTVFPNTKEYIPYPLPYYPPNQPIYTNPYISCNTGSDSRDMADNVPYMMNYTPPAYIFT